MWALGKTPGGLDLNAAAGNKGQDGTGLLGAGIDRGDGLDLELNRDFLSEFQALLADGNILPQEGMELPEMLQGLLAEGAELSDPGLAASALPLPLSLATEVKQLIGDKIPGAVLEAMAAKMALANGAPAAGASASPVAATAQSLLSIPLSGAEELDAVLPESGLSGVANATRVNTTLGASSTLTATTMSGVPQKVGSEGWDRSLADRVVWMANGGQQVAELKLNPAHLGPMEIRLTLQQDQASVAFTSQHAAVREALEMAIPRLREMLEQQDLRLVQVNVGEQGEFRRDNGAQGEMADQRGQKGEGSDGHVGSQAQGELTGSSVSGTGLVDLFV